MSLRERIYMYLKNHFFRMRKMNFFFFVFLFPVFSCNLFAQQETAVIGQVFDFGDKNPIPNVNIYFKNTDIGVSTDDEGFFFIRTRGNETVLVFSSVGYKKQEIKIKEGKLARVEIYLKEENTWLEDILVLPGTNPALDWLKKIRLMRKQNDVSSDPNYKAKGTEQDLLLLSKANQRTQNKRLFEQFQKGTLTDSDSSLLIPLYMAEKSYLLSGKRKTEIDKNTFSSSDESEHFVNGLLNGINVDLNFYENSVMVFDKSIISPLSSFGNNYYNYYLTDSIDAENGKQYKIKFSSKNPKNLAFNGYFLFDSISLSLTHIEATLPPKANINYIHNLQIKQDFKSLNNNFWAKESEELSLNMNYDVLIDSIYKKSELLIKRTNYIDLSDSIELSDNFARSAYSIQTLEDKMNAFDDTPLMRSAKWLADAVLTSYARFGVIDVGRLQQIVRLTDIEGLRVNLPLRSNERLWKNMFIGGYLGYGFKNEKIKYSLMGQYRLPFEKRFIVGFDYTDDYRRIDYNYNRFMMREDPWKQGDDDASNTIFSFLSAEKISPRKEWTISLRKDWNSNIESGLFYRSNTLFSNENMPLRIAGQELNSFNRQSLTLFTRFSFEQRTYEDHLMRMYSKTFKPIVYFITEGGKTKLNDQQHFYGKISATICHSLVFGIGDWNYMAEAGFILGKVPFPLLEIPSGNEPSGISPFHFNKMKYLEFASDKYLHLYNEFVFNGILFNYIPLIKHLNLREIITLKTAFGSLSEKHRALMDYPDFMHSLGQPYLEAGIGVTNLLRIFSVQATWRITNNYENISPWGISIGLRLGF